MITPRVMMSVTATLLIVVPICGQFRWAGLRQIGFPFESTFVTSIQIRSTVALAWAAPANPTRTATLASAAAANAVDFMILPASSPNSVWARTKTKVNFYSAIVNIARLQFRRGAVGQKN